MLKRIEIKIEGIVQAVGFRPFVHNQARKHKLTGFAANTGKGLMLQAQGSAQNLQNFLKELKTKAPALSKIESLTTKNLPLKKETGFKIINSKKSAPSTSIPPDIAICPACQKDIAAKNNRRYRYPFTNCTACGPRYTIIKTLPYDRAQTTMAGFKMCAACRAEFENSSDRRFHAQPNCCPACGPKVEFIYKNKPAGRLEEAAQKIREGKIIAIKSLGGFHLACDALNKAAVAALRRRKNRPFKPFAIMCGDIETAKKYCFINKAETKILKSKEAPAVMLKKRQDIALIAPGLDTIAVMLPYTPLHKILFDILGPAPLVMTSGNISGNPICINNDEARRGLGKIADGFLLHNRPIHNRIDDSVVFEFEGKAHFLRRARGYAPGYIKLPSRLKNPALGLGADLTNSFCLAKDDKLYLSQYIGDLDKAANTVYFKQTLAKMQKLLNIKPRVFVRDLHPAYFGARFKPNAQKVQHHLAHALSAAAEHNLQNDFLCLAFDGNGLGLDNTIWGGEFLEIRRRAWRRAGCFKPVRIFGGESASADIWKCALSYMLAAGIDNKEILRIIAPFAGARAKPALASASADLNCYTYSGIGRLFDAAAAILGNCGQATYQAQGALQLQALAEKSKTKNSYPFSLADNKFISIDTAPIIKGLVKDRKKPALAAAKFHNTLAQIALCAALKCGLKTVVLSGGVFQNKKLLGLCFGLLRKNGFKTLTNTLVPAGDGGLAIGQVYGAAYPRGYAGREK